MAKIIKLTPECIEQARQEFEASLANIKLSDGKINFTKSFATIQRRATIYFTEIAWLKMQTLIREFDKEVAWHGIASRGEDPEKDEYFITDIIVYPQTVTGVTVTTDQEEYENWLNGLEDDVFNNLRMQGHSHVNMGTTPSGVDNNLYESILGQLKSTMFYIFMIWNKKGEKTIKLYDMAKNVLFETADCTVSILDDGTGTEAFLKDARTKVRTAPIVPVASKPVQTTTKPAPVVSTTKKEEEKPRMGKRVKKAEKTAKPAYDQKMGYGANGYYYSGAYQDYDDPYGPFGYRESFYY